MGAVVVLLLLLAVGIGVGIKSGKLTGFELAVCGSFGLLLGATPIGAWVNSVVIAVGTSILPTVNGWLS